MRQRRAVNAQLTGQSRGTSEQGNPSRATYYGGFSQRHYWNYREDPDIGGRILQVPLVADVWHFERSPFPREFGRYVGTCATCGPTHARTPVHARRKADWPNGRDLHSCGSLRRVDERQLTATGRSSVVLLHQSFDREASSGLIIVWSLKLITPPRGSPPGDLIDSLPAARLRSPALYSN